MRGKSVCTALLFVLVFALLLPAGAEGAWWAKVYSGIEAESRAVQQTKDGGYIVAGWTRFYNSGGSDMWVLKLDSKSNVLWQKTFGGSNDEGAYSIQQTKDGGYIVAGYTSSYGAGGSDMWIIKLDSNGSVEWHRTCGGKQGEVAYSVKQTRDGGYIVAGYTSSYGAGKNDMRIIKLDAEGNTEWEKTYGGAEDDVAYSVCQTRDGGYMVVGYTESRGAGGKDMWMLKLNSGGELVWQKTRGWGDDEVAYSVRQTGDGGFIIAGSSNGSMWILRLDSSGNEIWQKKREDDSEAYSVRLTSDGGYIVGAKGRIVKLNANGSTEWEESRKDEYFYSAQQTADKGYIAVSNKGMLKLDSRVNEEWYLKHDSSESKANSVYQTLDGGYIVAGYAKYGSGGKDFWVLKLDSNGEVVWQKIYGGPKDDEAFFIQQTADGGYIVAGYTWSYGAGERDMWIIKLDKNGSVEWQKTYGGVYSDVANFIQQTADGGYIVAGYYRGRGFMWILKLDGNGSVEWQKVWCKNVFNEARSIQQTADGGYIVAGYTRSFTTGNGNMWILKLDENGSVEWQKTYGGEGDDQANYIQQTADGGYIVAGYTGSYGVGGSDMWIIKLDGNGSVEWQKTYGGKYWDEAYSIQQTTDGGYIVAAIYHGQYGSGDVWIVKLDGNGNMEWQKTCGRGAAYSIQQTTDGGYIVAGHKSGRAIVMHINSDGNIPGCSMIKTSGAVSSYTKATIEDSNATPGDSNAVVADSDAYFAGSSLIPVEVCSAGGALKYVVSVEKKGTGRGQVYSIPAGVNCGFDCTVDSGDFYPDTQVSLGASPEFGSSAFGGWGGDCKSCGKNVNCSLTVNKNFLCTATFSDVSKYTLSVVKKGSGKGTVKSNPAGIYCGPDCSEDSGEFDKGSKIKLTATASDGSVFSGWGGACSDCGKNEECTVTLNSDLTCTAAFDTASQDVTLTVEKKGSGRGTVKSEPAGIDCGPDCTKDSGKFDKGSKVKLTATASRDSAFSGWGGACGSCGKNKECTVILNSDLVCTATFNATGPAPGTARWIDSYGDEKGEYGADSVCETSDGGFVVAGWAKPTGKGYTDLWVLKLNKDGVIEWQKAYGGDNADMAHYISRTSDGGYIVAGETESWGAGWGDMWIIRLDSNGNVKWQKTYGGMGWDRAYCVQETPDGGYIVAGETRFGNGWDDVWVIKLDSNGNVEWQKTYGGKERDGAYYIERTSDGGYIVGGYTYSFGVNEGDIWVLKLDSSGNVKWQKVYGGPGWDGAHSVHETPDGGYIVAGEVDGSIAVIKLDSLGNIEWQKIYGGSDNNRAYSIELTPDGGYIFAGETHSFETGWWSDVWVVKLNPNGDIEWQKIYGKTGKWDEPRLIRKTSDDGYVVAGWTESFGTGEDDALVMKLDSKGNVSGCDVIRNSGVSAVDADLSVSNTKVVPKNTGVDGADSSARVSNTQAKGTEVCYAVNSIYTLTLKKEGKGKGRVYSRPSGIDCGVNCTEDRADFEDGTKVTLSAESDENSVFTGWGGDCKSCGRKGDCSLTVNSNRACTAAFADITTQVFNDVPPSHWAFRFINAIFQAGITVGCGGGNYCPDLTVTRAQMAVFILKSLGVSPASRCTGQVFADVNTSTVGEGFCKYIEKFAELGITSGCQADDPSTPENEAKFCPHLYVTRGQMAVFIVKAMGEQPAPKCTGRIFADVNVSAVGEGFCKYIERLYELGITKGYATDPPTYAPYNPVFRAEMAVFLTKGFLRGGSGDKLDEFWFNTRYTDIVTSSITLEKNKEYRIVIRGSYSAWSAWEWESGWEGILQEELPIYPDDAVDNSYAAVDVCYVYACPAWRHCNINNFPSRERKFKYSIDNGISWLEIGDLCPQFSKTHTYSFFFKGEGFPIKFKLIDCPNSDNYGLLKIEIFK